MPLFKRFFAALSFLGLLAATGLAADNSKATYDDPEAAAKDADFNLQGEYAAQIKDGDKVIKLGAHVIAQGNGKFRCVGYRGGLPGDGFDKELGKVEADGKPVDGGIEFVGEQHRGLLKGGVITVYDKESGTEICELKKVNRESPTLGAKPPAGAMVLFDGKTNAFKDGGKKVTKDGLLIGGVFSEATFGDFTLHVEFRTPFQPGAAGQGRGNSGVYMQGRYEVQVLDSFGLAGKDNECGGIYTIKAPDVNMCFPPLAWQTYDVDYTAARFDESGKKTAHARMTVKHNGVLIHKDVECPKATTAAPKGEGKENGPIYLQDHGNPVRYRNIWIVEKK
jgi:hypothetical protein